MAFVARTVGVMAACMVSFATLPACDGQTATDTKSVAEFLRLRYLAGNPTFTMSMPTNLVKTLKANAAQGQPSPYNQGDWMCPYSETYKVGSTLFRVRTNTDVDVGPKQFLFFMRWAAKHDLTKEISLTYPVNAPVYNQAIAQTEMKRQMFSQTCRVFKENEDLVNQSTIYLASAFLTAGDISTFKFNSPQFGQINAYYVPVTINLKALFPDVSVQPAQLTGHARVVIRPDTHKPELIDEEFDQLKAQYAAITINFNQ